MPSRRHQNFAPRAKSRSAFSLNLGGQAAPKIESHLESQLKGESRVSRAVASILQEGRKKAQISQLGNLAHRACDLVDLYRSPSLDMFRFSSDQSA